jgi:flagellar protein FlbD
MFINADLIESVEPTPDTVITMVDNRRLVVSESPEVIVARVQEFRASLLVAADTLRSGAPFPQLTVVPDLPDEPEGEGEAHSQTDVAATSEEQEPGSSGHGGR